MCDRSNTSSVTKQQHYLFENPTSAACIVMHALATLFLTKVPVETGCQPIVVSVVQKGCFSFRPLAAALPLSKSPLAGLAVAGRGLCARPPEFRVSEKSGICSLCYRAQQLLHTYWQCGRNQAVNDSEKHRLIPRGLACEPSKDVSTCVCDRFIRRAVKRLLATD